MSWWVTEPGGSPAEPVSTELLLRGISRGEIRADALVCRVGDQEWRPLAGIQRFADAFTASRERRRFSAAAEVTRRNLAFAVEDEAPVSVDSAALADGSDDASDSHRLQKYGAPTEGIGRIEPATVEPEHLRSSSPPPALARAGQR